MRWRDPFGSSLRVGVLPTRRRAYPVKPNERRGKIGQRAGLNFEGAPYQRRIGALARIRRAPKARTLGISTLQAAITREQRLQHDLATCLTAYDEVDGGTDAQRKL
jgi:hypothetical protein